jgi:hypothetical protein
MANYLLNLDFREFCFSGGSVSVVREFQDADDIDAINYASELIKKEWILDKTVVGATLYKNAEDDLIFLTKIEV